MAPLRHYDAVLFRNFYRGQLVWRFRPRWSGALCAVSRTCSVTLFKPACANAGHFTARNGSSRRTIVERAAFARAMIRQLSIRSSMVGAEVELQLRELRLVSALACTRAFSATSAKSQEPALVRQAPAPGRSGVKRPLFFSSWPFALIAVSDDLKRRPFCSRSLRPP